MPKFQDTKELKYLIYILLCELTQMLFSLQNNLGHM